MSSTQSTKLITVKIKHVDYKEQSEIGKVSKCNNCTSGLCGARLHRRNQVCGGGGLRASAIFILEGEVIENKGKFDYNENVRAKKIQSNQL